MTSENETVTNLVSFDGVMPLPPRHDFELAERTTPDNPPWGAGMGFITLLMSVFFLFFCATVIPLTYLAVNGVRITDSEVLKEITATDANFILVSILAIIPAHLMTLGFVFALIRRFEKLNFREAFGWKWNGFEWWHCLIAVGGFYILAGILGAVFGEQDNELLRVLRSSRTTVFAVAFLATFTAPLVEEVVYRGVLYSGLRKNFGVAAAIILSTLLFALVHVPQYYPSIATIIIILVLSLTLTLIRAKTGNLLPCIVLHTIFNASQSLLLIAEPYLKSASEQNAEGFVSVLRHFF